MEENSSTFKNNSSTILKQMRSQLFEFSILNATIGILLKCYWNVIGMLSEFYLKSHSVYKHKCGFRLLVYIFYHHKN